MSDDDLATLEQQLAGADRQQRLDSAKSQAVANVDQLGQWLRDHDRSFVVKMVIGLYVFSLAAIIVYLIIHGLCSNESAYANIADVIKVAIVPVVTLVIGYYF